MIDDLDGDGIDDVILSGPSAYVVSGAVRADTWTSIFDLRLIDSLIARLEASNEMILGGRSDGGRFFADLGDPRPGNGVDERLIVSANPRYDRDTGAVAVHLLVRDESGIVDTEEVALFEGSAYGARFGASVASIGDANGDGVDDLIVHEQSFEDPDTPAGAPAVSIGRLLVIDGAALLDGFAEDDVLQTIYGTVEDRLLGSVCFAGDLDGDGLSEVLVGGSRPQTGDAFVAIYTVVPPGSEFVDCNENDAPDFTDVRPSEFDFQRPVYSPVSGEIPQSVAIADFDGDGLPDLAVANLRAETISVLHNTGDFRFTETTAFPSPVGATAVVAADFDLDGDQDIASADFEPANRQSGDRFGHTVSIYLNSGAGLFAPARSFEVSDAPADLVAADLDGDQFPDLAVISRASRGDFLTILRNVGDARFETSHEYDNGLAGAAVVALDIEGDGDTDIVVANRSAESLGIYRNDGDARFEGPEFHPSEGEPIDLVAADFDGDGRLDVATADRRHFGVSVHRNLGGGVLEAPRSYVHGRGTPVAIAAADFDGDGDCDLVVSNESAETTWVLRNDGVGRFFEIHRYQTAVRTFAVATADLDADGNSDVVLPDTEFQEIVVLPNRTLAPRSSDCNQNGVPDDCDIASGVGVDCDGDLTLDECAVAKGVVVDCNRNGVPDTCDIASGTSTDCNADLVPDECVRVVFHRGDADGDGQLDVSDAIFSLGFQFLGAAAPSCLDAADTNDDGRLDLSDAVSVLGFLFLGAPPPPAPGPPPQPCGPDSDPCDPADSLGCRGYRGCR